MNNIGQSSGPFLTGCGTALVTPFCKDGSIDEVALRRLVSRQIRCGVKFLVPCGTTGESPTLSHEEHLRVIQIVVDEAKYSDTLVIPGTGSNSTREAVELTEHAMLSGADGVLVVAPYYNKPTQDGIAAYFTSVADVGLPVIVYNIPGRTGIDVLVETLVALSLHKNIVGIKEATGSLDRMSTDILLCGKNFSYLSGDDSLTLPLLSIGGSGVISVISNLFPVEVVNMVQGGLAGDFEKARELHYKLFRICRTMFVETNPIPIKLAMAMTGMIKPVFRSPLGYPKEETIKLLYTEIAKFGFVGDLDCELVPISVVA